MKNEEKEDEQSDVFGLILKLRQEKSYITNEKNKLQELNTNVRSKTQKVLKKSWMNTKQRLLLYQRKTCLQNLRQIDVILSSNFVEARKRLGFEVSDKVGKILQSLRDQPEELARILINGDHLTDNYHKVLQTLVNGLYACCLFSDDKKYMLTLLYELGKHQLSQSDDPRSLLKQGNSPFRHLYQLFNEVSQQAKFFLSAALEMPIVRLLSNSDTYLDVDPEKSLMRFKTEIAHSFNDAQEHRTEVIHRLVELTNCFASSILDNVYSFPKSIAWIILQVCKMVEKTYGKKESNAMVTELTFTLYICPIIVNPEQYGICTLEISEIARHNLIQVGQLLQSLALYKYEKPEAKLAPLFDSLDRKSIATFLELFAFELDNEKAPPIDMVPSLTRDILMFTESELYTLLTFLQRVQYENRNNNEVDKSPLSKMSLEDQLAKLNIGIRPENSSKPGSRPSSGESSDSSTNKSKFFSAKNNLVKNHIEERKANTVLIFPIDNVDCAPIGLLPEEKVLLMAAPVNNGLHFEVTASDVVEQNIPDTVHVNGDIKPSSFSNFADEGSIGNTSDNLEAISEAASNHSVASSLELETEDQNDNLSDMVSANVSGRGSPNISGRDTPSSQVNENEDRVIEARPVDIVQPQPQLTRQIRSEIDDKFCKFEIKKLLEGDETISIISETWSTDVLASDNETIDAGDSRQERQSFQLVDQAIHEVPIGNILDISETQSESAWSTDVTASDTERLIEVDIDDAGSVAQSDDTNSVARSDDTRSETEENGPAILRRLSSSSNSFSNNPPNNNLNYVTNASSLQEYRKEIKGDRMNGKIFHSEQMRSQVDTNANNVIFKSTTDTQQIAHNSISFSEHKTSEIKTTYSRSTVTTFNNTVVTNGKDCDLINLAGPSGLNKRCDAEAQMNYQNRISKKFDDHTNEILLSNCSLNSSSSGSSSNSFENKNSHNDTEMSEQWENKQWLNSSGSSLNVTLTPSESTSELSILSVNNINNPTVLNKKSATLLTQRSKPSVSTGAIPKSISFDMTADKGLEDHKKRGTFFDKIRKGFKPKKGKGRTEEGRMDSDDYSTVKRNSVRDSPIKMNNNMDASSEDILAKYRSPTKPFVENSPSKTNCDAKSSKESVSNFNCSTLNSFNDIKKKVRLALCNTSEVPFHIKTPWISAKSKLETVLRLELGKAKTMKEFSEVARILEAIRCVSLLDNEGCLKLLQSLRHDILQRTTYIQYLVASKQELLYCDRYLNSLLDQISHERIDCERYLGNICVQDFLSQKEELVARFYEEFMQLTLADEKYDLLNKFYDDLYSIMESSNWEDVLKNKEAMIKNILERSIMNKVYIHSLYPNGDGDKDRDSLLEEHIQKLSKIITPHHKDLMIQKEYLREYPWQPAQDALSALNASRTPRDKVSCVMQCAKCIMDLLSLSQNTGSTTADDFTPVLVYVIIKVNPKALLSTVQFVNSFYGNQLIGEEEYWWTQFCSAVEFIKTMDYSD